MSRSSNQGRSTNHGKHSHYERDDVHGRAQYAHEVRSNDDGDSVDSHYSDSDHKHSAYKENTHACHDESDDDKAKESIVNDHAVTSYSPYMRNPSTSKHNNDYVKTLLKRTLSPSDVGDHAHSAHVRIEEPHRKAFNSSMTHKSMLRISDYNHPGNNDDALPRGRAIAHAYKCMIKTDSDNEDTTGNERAESHLLLSLIVMC